MKKPIIAGIDEVGRGCLAGPLVAAAAILKSSIPQGIRDSKLLSAKKRDVLFPELVKHSNYAIGIVSEKEIDELGLTKANELAMQRSLNQLDQTPDLLLIDGNIVPNLINKSGKNFRTMSIIRGDEQIYSIATASIIAKVTRDRIMRILHLEYPHYCWLKNVGYGTKEHIASIKSYGISKYHRKSFAPIKFFHNI